MAEGERVTEALRQYAAAAESSPNAGSVDPATAEAFTRTRSSRTETFEPVTARLAGAGEAFDRGFQQLQESFDPEQGGFGGAPKFPRAAGVQLSVPRVAAIQGVGIREPARAAVQMATLTLRKMAEGGMHDHVGRRIPPLLGG